MPLMSVFCGENCNTLVERKVEPLAGVAGRIVCLECGGDGNWGKFAPEIVGRGFPCPVCMGTGIELIGI